MTYDELKNIVESYGFNIESFNENELSSQDLYIFVPDTANFKTTGRNYSNPLAYRVMATPFLSRQREVLEMTVYYRILEDKDKKLYFDGISYKLEDNNLTEEKVKALFKIFKIRIKNKKMELKMNKIEEDFE